MKKVQAVIFFAGLGAVSLFGQAGQGAIAGSVRDASGATVPAATVIITNEAKGIRREMETTSAGAFSAPALVPAGGYAVEVNKTGFAKYETKGITLQVGDTLDLAVALTVATATTDVQVIAETPLISDTKSGVADLINQQQIDELPINGRRADTFALLTPGVVRDGTFGLVSFHGISSGKFVLDGRNEHNQHVLR